MDHPALVRVAVAVCTTLCAALLCGASDVLDAQTSPPIGDASTLFTSIQRYAAETGSNYEQPVVVDYGDELTRQLASLLVDYKNVAYTTLGPNYTPAEGAIVIVAAEHLSSLSLGDRYGEPLAFGLDLAIFPRQGAATQVGPSAHTDGSQLVIGGQGSNLGQFDGPSDVALDSVANVYVADTNNNRVEKFDSQGNFVAVAGGIKTELTMNQPWSIVVARDGTAFVVDTWDHKVVELNKDLKRVGEWGGGGQEDAGGDPFKLFGPRDIALSPEGHVFVVDSGNNRVIEYDANGTFVRQFGSKGTSGDPLQFNEPSSLAVTANGDIFIADFWNRRIVHLDKDLKSKGEIKVDGWGSQAVTDRGYITTLPNGRLLATDPTHGKILAFAADGTSIAEYVVPKEGSHPQARPIGIATDGTSVLVTDSIGNVARKIPLSEILPETRDPSRPPDAVANRTTGGSSGRKSAVAWGLVAVGGGLFAVAAVIVVIGLRRSRGGEP